MIILTHDRTILVESRRTILLVSITTPNLPIYRSAWENFTALSCTATVEGLVGLLSEAAGHRGLIDFHLILSGVFESVDASGCVNLCIMCPILVHPFKVNTLTTDIAHILVVFHFYKSGQIIIFLKHDFRSIHEFFVWKIFSLMAITTLMH